VIAPKGLARRVEPLLPEGLWFKTAITLAVHCSGVVGLLSNPFAPLGMRSGP
jgi:hypothetical protein